MSQAITYTGSDGHVIAMAVTPDGMEDGETEAEYLGRMIDVFVPEPFRASAQVVDIAQADAAVAPTLAEMKDGAKGTIDAAAEEARQFFITPGDGQAMNYLDKRVEADTWQAIVDDGGSPDPADPRFARIKARAERLDPATPDYQAVVTDWLQRGADWKAVDIAIDTAREGGKDAVDAAADQVAIDAAVGTALAAYEVIKAQAD